MAGPYAIVTLVSSDAYLPGALAQAAALRDLHPHPPVFPELSFQTVCLVTPETVDVATIKLLRRAFDLVIGVEVLEAENNNNLQLLGRPDLTTVLTKLHVFRLTQYSKIIFLDADVLPIRPLSHLFNIPHEFAAAPDVGWPDIFNSGVLVLSPGEDKFDDLNDLLKSKGSWDGGDQGLLNEWRAGDWHRLSFTYNTTPTAAYTYAPAYERYGSQINAIHFIGPNKPWNSIPFRSPFLAEKRTTSQPRSIQQAYDYESLVDRWFAVYDKHYRSQPIIPPSFEVKHYSSAWDSPDSTNFVETGPRRRPFDLEDLRKIAVEGMTAAGFVSSPFVRNDGEGEYRTLPLEGRFDLMRPKKPLAAESEGDSSSTPVSVLSPEPTLEQDFMDTDRDLPMTPMARHLDLPDDAPRWHTLPTPGPEEFPPSPKLPLRSLPGTPTSAPDYYASSAGQTSDSEGWHTTKDPSAQASQSPSHLFTQTPPSHRPPPHNEVNGESLSPQHHGYHHGHHHQHIHHNHHHRNEDSRHQDGQHQHGSPRSQNQQGGTPRPPSPPLVSWNPAVEPPPSDPPPPSAFPVDTYFTNAWDSAHGPESLRTQKGSPGHHSGFFQAPPPPRIPEALRMQGQYRNVTGEATTDSDLLPNLNKVKPVFPWEDKPRQMPGRVFPDSDAPSPAKFTSPRVRTAPATPKMPESKPLKQSSPSPLPRLPSTLSYSNAWDTDPIIQNYASRLVRPSPPVPALASAFDDNLLRGNGRGKSWDEKVEASSRDGDDEDDGDDDSDPDEVESDDDRKSQHRSPGSSSLVEDTRQVQKSAQKLYRSQGVQTVPREKRNQSVQVSVLVETPSPDPSRRLSLSSKRSATTSSGASIFPGREAIRTPDSSTRPTASPTPTFLRTRSISSGSFDHRSPGESVPRPRREFLTSPSSVPPRPPTKLPTPRPSVPPKVPTPPNASTAQRAMTPPKAPTSEASTPPARPSIQTNRHAFQPTKAPSVSQRQISNDSSIGSPPSSIDPVSPPDDRPFTASPVRKGTRVWDPARGVDVFKRGSEEVLARFLKMGSWDDSNR